MKPSFRIARIAGIDISIHWTFFLLLAWVAISGAREKTIEAIGLSLGLVLSLFLCVVLHELGHALTAKRFGIITRGITLYPIGGVALLESLPERPRQELLVALAGPLVNVVIAAGIYLSFYFSGNTLQLLNVTSAGELGFWPTLLFANTLLAVFNLLPAFPMDGGRVLRAVLAMLMERDRATQIAMKTGRVMAILFIIAGFYANPMLIIIGAFVFIAGQSEASHVHVQTVLKGYRAKDAMMKEYHTIDAGSTIGDAVRKLLDVQGSELVVMEKEQIVGLLDRNLVIRVLGERGVNAEVRDVMQQNLASVPEEMALDKVYDQLSLRKQSIFPVLRDGQVQGIIDSENILEFLMIQETLRHKTVF